MTVAANEIWDRVDEMDRGNCIALNNSDWRRMLRELTTPRKGVRRLVGGSGVSDQKGVSKLTTEVSGLRARIIRQIRQMHIVRILNCVNGELDVGVIQLMNLINEHPG